jgi:hypothetical protein
MGSGITAALTTYYLNSSKEHVFQRRQKSEDLFRAFDVFNGRMQKYQDNTISLFKGQMSFSEFREQLGSFNMHNNDPGHEFREIRMLVGVYFPEISAELDAVLRERENGMDMLRSRFTTYAQSPDSTLESPEELSRFMITVRSFRNASRSFENKVIECASTAASSDALLPSGIVQIRARIKKNRAVNPDE